MNNEPVVVERTFNVPVERVWAALTENEQMKKWYFQLPDFRAEVGFEFTFTGGSETKQYVHLCRVTEVVVNKKLAYTWEYEGNPGHSHVTFDLFDEGDKTRVRITHEGVHTFANGNPDFEKKSFLAGWTDILGTLLKKHLEG